MEKRKVQIIGNTKGVTLTGKRGGFMRQYLIVILLLLSACSHKYTGLPNEFQGEKFEEMKNSMSKLYAVASSGEVNLNAQKGNGYVKWDEKGATFFISEDFVPADKHSAEEFKKVRECLQKLYGMSSMSEGYVRGTEIQMQWDERGATVFRPR